MYPGCVSSMRAYWQWIGDRYSEAFASALAYHVAIYIRTERRAIPTLPPVTAIPTERRPQRGQSRRVREA